MTEKERIKLKAALDDRKNRGVKWSLSLALKCDPSKITKALVGHVKDEEFLARLQAEAKVLLRRKEAAMSI